MANLKPLDIEGYERLNNLMYFCDNRIGGLASRMYDSILKLGLSQKSIELIKSAHEREIVEKWKDYKDY